MAIRQTTRNVLRANAAALAALLHISHPGMRFFDADNSVHFLINALNVALYGKPHPDYEAV